jgi:hypothetical protein
MPTGGERGREPRMSLDELFAFNRLPGFRRSAAERLDRGRSEPPPSPAALPPGLREAFELPLADAILSRRSRRFGLGMSLPSGPLSHRSRSDPVSLSELEEAVLLWLGTGITGLALGDLPPDGLSWMHRWVGRAWPCSVNSHSTELFFTNDSGLHVVRLRGRDPDRGAAATPAATPSEVVETMVRLLREVRLTLEPGRADLPTGEPGLFAFNAWNVNKPGTSLFIPVTDTSVEYMTLLFIYFDERNRFAIVDELGGGSACGLERWVRSGRLGLTELSLIDLELRVLTTLNVEGAFICQNMNLALQALGLGGWAFTGFLPHHVLGADPAHRGLGFDFVTPDRTPRAHARPVPVGRAGVHEGLCPPYVSDMREAVQRFLADRHADPRRASPYVNSREVLAGREDPSEETIEIVTAFAQYVLDTYGRFPAFIDPMFVRLVLQAHHLDLEFYDRHYSEGAYSDLHRRHMELWHASEST